MAFRASKSRECRVKLTGGQVIAKALRAYGLRYVAGVPGNGNSGVLEGLNTPGVSIPFIRVVNEQSAVHMADGYFRACGSAMAVVLPAKTGIFTASAALSNCLSDSCGVLLLTGDRVSDDTPAGSTGSTRPGSRWDADSACGGLKRSWKVRALSEPVLVEGNGIGAIADDHDLNAGSVGSVGSACGAALLGKADVIVAVGS